MFGSGLKKSRMESEEEWTVTTKQETFAMKCFSARVLVFVSLLLAPGVAHSQDAKTEDVWKPFRYFLGSWEGTVAGKFGKGVIESQYSLVLDDAFLQVVHRTDYEPTERHPQGEVHKEIALLGFDRAAATYVLRQFHNETIFNEYTAESISPDGRTIVLVTRHIENYAPGWRARETWQILGPDEFLETFELAPPGKDFVTYVENRFRRKR